MDTITPEQLAALPLFDRNRMAIPTSEWQRYIGQWVALNADGSQIVAGAANVGLLIDKLREMRVDLEEVTLEGVEEPDVV
ncbi:MAG: hypothetical protein K8R36_10280 [Planctomycetales bacterium]|nr:hypothetical protein [Planctomycetales bacterium]